MWFRCHISDIWTRKGSSGDKDGVREDKDGSLTFVALTRVKAFKNIFLEKVGWGRLKQINDKKMIDFRIEEEGRLKKVEKSMFRKFNWKYVNDKEAALM